MTPVLVARIGVGVVGAAVWARIDDPGRRTIVHPHEPLDGTLVAVIMAVRPTPTARSPHETV